MYYSSFCILAIILHIIINRDVLKNGKKEEAGGPRYRYRQFLLALQGFYLADMLWGFLVEYKLRIFAYADTMLFFLAMAFSVLLWTKYVVAFIGRNGRRANCFLGVAWGIFLFVVVSLIVNFFYPFVFSFSQDTVYFAGRGRYILLGLQFLHFFLISVYSLGVSLKAEGRDKPHYITVFVSGGVMTLFIALQMGDAFAPFYTIGCLIANCLLHVFVEEDEKHEQEKITAVAQKEKEIYNQIAMSLATDYEAIYYINIETGKYIEVSASQMYHSMNVPQKGDDFYKETRENVLRYAHPDDRLFAESMYYKETMLKNLEGQRSYSYQYRIMVGDEARYFRFVVLLSDDKEHFVLCDKDIQDTITAETSLLERQKNVVTFSQIAESLASNYDVIYYVNMETGDYAGYSSSNIYGGLKINEYGNDFFADAAKNLELLIHPQDRERLLSVLNKDHLLSALEERKEYIVRYRMIVNGLQQHTRLSVRKTSDGRHTILGVENIENEVRKEKELLHALNTEKELARRDELTGIRNKTAFIELEKAIQENLDSGMTYLPFAFAVCDLNDLKKINDTKGHKAGDDYIRSSVKLLCEIFKHSPVFRVGGDEFVVFLRGEDYLSRKTLIKRLHEESVANRDRQDGPVIAAGLAEYIPEKDSDVSEVFDRADHKMYENKRALKKNVS